MAALFISDLHLSSSRPGINQVFFQFLLERAFLAQPLAERKRRIAALRRRSEIEKKRKPAEIMDVNAGAVESLLRAHGYPRLIHGHTHRPARHEHRVDGRVCERWVLTDWYESGGVLVCDEKGCRAENFSVGEGV